MKNRLRTHYYVLGFACLLAMAQIHHILLFFSSALGADIDAAIGVATGHPHWRVYQNRVLGPYLLKGLAGLFSDDYVGSYIFLLAASLVLAGYQAWRIGNKIGGAQTGWFALVLLHLSLTFLFSRTWLYIWDFIGLNVFLAFVEFVVFTRPWYWFTALFAVGILNRDSGQFIALWLVLEPACRWLIRRPLPKRTAATMLAAGILCFVAGGILINYLRTSLLIEEVGFSIIGGTPAGYGPDYFWKLPDNLYLLQHVWGADLNSILTLSLSITIYLAVMSIAIVLLRRDPARYMALATTFIIAAASILLFGNLPETRVFIEIIPILLLGSCVLSHPGKDPSQARIMHASAGE